MLLMDGTDTNPMPDAGGLFSAAQSVGGSLWDTAQGVGATVAGMMPSLSDAGVGQPLMPPGQLDGGGGGGMSGVNLSIPAPAAAGPGAGFSSSIGVGAAAGGPSNAVEGSVFDGMY